MVNKTLIRDNTHTMDFFTPEFWDTLVIVIVLLGSALAVVRLYRDFTRPLPPSRQFPPIAQRNNPDFDADTRQHQPTTPETDEP